MRIGFNCKFLHAAYVTGVERYARNLLANIVDAGREEEFLLFGCGERPALASPHGNVRQVGSCAWRSAAARQLWEQMILPGLASKAQVDVLVNPANTAPLRFSRNVVVIHDLSFLEHPEWFSRGFRWLYRSVVPRAARGARAVITDSEFSKGRIVELLGVASEKVHAVYLAADPAFRPLRRSAVEDVAHKFGIARPYVLFVGSIGPRKNLATAVAAFEIANTRLSTAHMMVVAGVTSFQFPKAEVPTGAGRVMAIGYTNDADLSALYAGARALLYPSLYEGFGLPPLEAMACRTPVVTSNSTSLPEVVGDAALVVDPTNVDDVAEAIHRVLSDQELAEDLRRRGLERAKLFSWEDTARGVLEVCRQAAASSVTPEYGG